MRPALLIKEPSSVTTLYRSWWPEWYANFRASSSESHRIASPTAYATALLNLSETL